MGREEGGEVLDWSFVACRNKLTAKFRLLYYSRTRTFPTSPLPNIMSSTTRSGREYKGEGKVSHVPSAGHTQGHVVSAAHVLQGHVVSAAHVQQEGHVDPVCGNGQVGAFVTGNYTNVVTSAGDGVTASAGGYDPLSFMTQPTLSHGSRGQQICEINSNMDF